MIRPLLISFGALTLLTGLAYPVAMTGASKLLFPKQAAGSLVIVGGQVRGSSLVGQATEDPRYFWSRPSATGTFQCNPEATGGSYLAPSNPALAEAVAKRIQALKASDPTQEAPIPQDLITASGSGLDPDISADAARWQVPRIAKARGIPPETVSNLVDGHVKRSLTGGSTVRVLELNVELDRLGGR